MDARRGVWQDRRPPAVQQCRYVATRSLEALEPLEVGASRVALMTASRKAYSLPQMRNLHVKIVWPSLGVTVQHSTAGNPYAFGPACSSSRSVGGASCSSRSAQRSSLATQRSAPSSNTTSMASPASLVRATWPLTGGRSPLIHTGRGCRPVPQQGLRPRQHPPAVEKGRRRCLSTPRRVVA